MRKNKYSTIEIAQKPEAYCGDELKASFHPVPGDNLRTQVGRRRLQRYINRLQAIHNDYVYRSNTQ